MMTTGDSKMCNGWSNKETWLVELWFGDILSDMASEGRLDASQIEDFVTEMLAEQMPESGLIADFVNDSFREVNWHELAMHHFEDVEEDA
jgi:hypothetical protein